MITLTTPVAFGTETDAQASMASAKGDALNNRLEIVEVYGNGTSNIDFVPSSQLPAMFVRVDLLTGIVYVNGIPKQSNGQPVALTPTQISSIKDTMTSFQSEVENKLVELEVFAGTVS